jgi:hypothetical protein
MGSGLYLASEQEVAQGDAVFDAKGDVAAILEPRSVTRWQLMVRDVDDPRDIVAPMTENAVEQARAILADPSSAGD